MVSLNLTQTHVTEWALVCWQPCDKSWSSWLRETSVSSSRLCCLLRAWQFLGWKHGKGGHQVKSCKDKSYCPGVRLIPYCKLQTYTFKNFSEKNPEKAWNKYSENSWWTEMFLNDLELLVLVSSSLPDPRSSKLQLQATAYPCISWQNHCNALSWQWVFCFHKSLCLFFFFFPYVQRNRKSVKGTTLCLASTVTYDTPQRLWCYYPIIFFMVLMYL